MRPMFLFQFRPSLFLRQRCGATMLEMAVALPLVLALMYVVIDLSRYWAVQGVLTQGAQRGINLAIKIPDLERNDARFLKARMRVVCGDSQDCVSNPAMRNGDAVQMPLGTLVSNWDQTGATAHFVGFANYPLAPGVTGNVNAALLRPGDACINDRDGNQHCHPTVCDRTGPCGAGARRRGASESIASLLETEPIVVVMPVKFKTLLPLPIAGVYSVKGVAAGYREIIASGAYPIPPEPPEPPVPSPSNTPTVTPTHNPLTPVPPTPTPRPTSTPVPTVAPTPSCPQNCESSAQIAACSSVGCPYCDRGVCRCTSSCGGG